VLLLDTAIPQNMGAVVNMVDKMLLMIVRCVAGCDEFSKAHSGKLMGMVCS